MNATATSFYVTGGTLHQDAPSYVERRADRELFEGLQRGQFCYVLTSRQMGKSSLMVHTAAQLREAGATVVVLDLTAVGQNLSADQWYGGLLRYVGMQLDPGGELEEELEALWFEGEERIGPLERWMRALREVVLPRCPERIVIFIDEIDAVRSLPFSTDEFFAGIRECYNRRTQDPGFERLTFCLLGVASPSDLIQEVRTTPFNIGKRVELTDFTAAEAAPLADGLGRDATANQALLERVLYWTSGHPYLTQRLCQAVADHSTAPSAEHRAPSTDIVDQMCAALFLSASAREKDDNLLFVRDRLLRSESDLASLLDLYGQVRAGKRVWADDTNPLIDLVRLSGIVSLHDGHLRVRNRIYQRVFDRAWVTQHMPDAELRRQRAAYRRGVQRTAGIAAVVVAVVSGLALTAIDQARLAREQRHAAEERERTARRYLYVAQMNVAQQALGEGNRGRAVELLSAQRPNGRQEDLRGFEWRYLWRLCRDQSLATLHGPEEIVATVAFSPDGKLLAAGYYFGGTVNLWETATKRKVATLNGQMAEGNWVAFSPDGKTLAAGGRDAGRKRGIVDLWEVDARHGRGKLKGQMAGAGPVAFSPDGKTLATEYVSGPTNDAGVALWDTASQRKLATLEAPRIWSLAFSPDGKTLAAGSQRGTVTLWDAATRHRVALLKIHVSAGWVPSVSFSPDGKTLATTSSDTVKLWDVSTRRERARLLGHTSQVMSVSFSPDGKTLATSSWDHTARLWDVATKQPMATLTGHESEVWNVAFSPDGKLLATGSKDYTVKLWSTASPRKEDRLQAQTSMLSVAFSPDGKTLATGNGNLSDPNVSGAVNFWDVGSQRHLASLPHRSAVTCVAFSPDGRTLASASSSPYDRAVKLWNVAARREVARLTRPPEGATAVRFSAETATAVRFSPDGQSLAVLWDRGTITLWDAAARSRKITIEGHPSYSIAFSPDGRSLASAGKDKVVRLWDVATGRQIVSLKGHRNLCSCVEFSPDGKTLASGDLDGRVKLWDMATKQELVTLRGHKIAAQAIAFSPDGQTLASAAGDKVVKLWNLATRQEVASLKGHDGPVLDVAFSPDGNTLATAGADKTVRLWRAATFAETDAHDSKVSPDRGR